MDIWFSTSTNARPGMSTNSGIAPHTKCNHKWTPIKAHCSRWASQAKGGSTTYIFWVLILRELLCHKNKADASHHMKFQKTQFICIWEAPVFLVLVTYSTWKKGSLLIRKSQAFSEMHISSSVEVYPLYRVPQWNRK